MRALVLVVAAVALALAAPSAAHAAGRSPLRLNLAVGAQARATSYQPDHPASAATDGNAATPWCSTGPASVVVDLRRPVALSGAGVTLLGAPSQARIDVSVDGRHWRRVTPAGFSAPAGAPAYAPPFGGRARYGRLTLPGQACVGELRLFGPDRVTRSWALGADLSFTPQEEEAGTVFTDRGRAEPVERIFADHGANYVRLRLWVDPPAGYSDLRRDLAFARRVEAAGMKLYLDIHYSDFWADPQHQDTPAAWQGEDLPALAHTVRGYTRHVVHAFAAQGTPIDMVSIGNEIRNGFLWPTGQLDGSETQWHAFGELLKAGVAGAREGDPRGHRLRIMLHYDQGGDNAGSRDFFDHIRAEGVPFDVIGLSYYSFWHGPLTALRANVDDLARRYDKDVMVAEIQYAWTLGYGDSTNNFVWQESQLEPGYPASPAGQLSFVNDVLSILARVPGHRGDGLFYWEPEWVPGVGWEPGDGTPNDNLTLFDFGGAALPSIGIFEDPVRAPTG